MIATALTIYATGFVVVVLWALSVIAHEPTAHGQGVMLPIGCLITIGWPVVLLFALVVGLYTLVSWPFRKRGS